jgi:hypothetical protein
MYCRSERTIGQILYVYKKMPVSTIKAHWIAGWSPHTAFPVLWFRGHGCSRLTQPRRGKLKQLLHFELRNSASQQHERKIGSTAIHSRSLAKVAQLKRLFLYSIPFFVILTALLLAQFRISASLLTASNLNDKMGSGDGYRAVSPTSLAFLLKISGHTDSEIYPRLLTL